MTHNTDILLILRNLDGTIRRKVYWASLDCNKITQILPPSVAKKCHSTVAASALQQSIPVFSTADWILAPANARQNSKT